jgi:hypothetical protein
LVSLLRLEIDTMSGLVLAGETVDLARLVAAKMLPERALVAPAPPAEVRFGNDARKKLRALIERNLGAPSGFFTAMIWYAKAVANGVIGDVRSARTCAAQFDSALKRVPAARRIFNNRCICLRRNSITEIRSTGCDGSLIGG